MLRWEEKLIWLCNFKNDQCFVQPAASHAKIEWLRGRCSSRKCHDGLAPFNISAAPAAAQLGRSASRQPAFDNEDDR